MIICGLVFVGSALYFFINVTRNPLASVSKPLGYNVFFPIQDKQDASTIKYYTGNTFASLDTRTGLTKPLTPHLAIPNVTQVYWLDQAVVFNSSGPGLVSDLTSPQQTIIDQRVAAGDPIDYSTNLYWYLSFTDNILRPLRAGSVSPSLFGVTTDNGGFLFQKDSITYSLLKPGGQVTEDYLTLPLDSRVISFSGSVVTYIQNKDNKLELYTKTFSQDAKHIKTLDTGPEPSLYLPLGVLPNALLYTKQMNGAAELLRDGTNTQVVAPDFSGNIYQHPQYVSTVNVGKDVLSFTVFTTSGSQTSKALLPYSSPAKVMRLDELNLLYSDLSGKLYEVSTNLPAVKAASNAPLEEVVTGDGKTRLTRTIESQSDNDYSITYLNSDYQTAMKTIYSQLSSKGIDPNRYSFSLNPGSGSDN